MLLENKQIDVEKRTIIESFVKTVQKFHMDKVDPMEFYLLKSIALFKSSKLSLYLNNISAFFQHKTEL
jgi:hypothetical protein